MPQRIRRAIVLCGLLPAAGYAQEFADVEIKTTHVAGSVYMLEGRGGNIGVTAGPDGLIMIDDQFEPLAPKIREALDKLAKGNGELKFVLNTHFHGDHTGGNPVFGREATIIAHSNVRKRLITAQDLRGKTRPPLPESGWPVITFEESVSLHFNGEEIRALHMANAHTDGDSVIIFTKSKVAHLGDLFFAGRFPYVDLDHGGNVQHLALHIGRLVEELPADVRIIPGHGPLSNRDDLKEYHRMLTFSIEHVGKHLRAGRNIGEIQAIGMPSEWRKWGAGFITTERWLETVATSLVRNNEGALTP